MPDQPINSNTTPVKAKKVKKPKKQKVKQGHKLVWLTLIIILIPVVIIGYILLVSARESDQPVIGNRFGANDLNPKITQEQVNGIQNELMNIAGVESASANLKSATLRVHLNMVDDAGDDVLTDAANQAWNVVANWLPTETYFTNTADGKNYDLEIDAYNYLVDDSHPYENWHFVKLTKTGAGDWTLDNLTQPKNPELSQNVRYHGAVQDQAPAAEETPEETPAEEVPAE